MEPVCYSETFVSFCESIWRYNPEKQHRYIHCRENSISQHRDLGRSSFEEYRLGCCKQPGGRLRQMGARNSLIVLVSGARNSVF